jgi:hypothetical protein
MRIRFAACVAVFLAALPGCASENEGCVEKSSCSYRNTFDFVWESADSELRTSWQIACADKKKKTITTCWATNLSPFSSHGRRDRLVVTITGTDQCGWKAGVRQESETNTNEENPLDESKAKWSKTENDGGLAARFLQNLDTRMQPDERWRARLSR